jgi:hypothetical protein
MSVARALIACVRTSALQKLYRNGQRKLGAINPQNGGCWRFYLLGIHKELQP